MTRHPAETASLVSSSLRAAVKPVKQTVRCGGCLVAFGFFGLLYIQTQQSRSLVRLRRSSGNGDPLERIMLIILSLAMSLVRLVASCG